MRKTEGGAPAGNLTIDAKSSLSLGEQLTGGDVLTSESDITASSELGVDGTVEIANTGLEVNSALVELPAYFSDVDNQVAASCAQSSGNQFVASGRGGLAMDPRDRLSATHLWQDTRSLSVTSETASETASETTSEDNKTLAEATRWQHNSQGQVELIAAASSEFALAQTVCLSRE